MRASAPTRAPAAPCQPRIASVRAPGRVQGPARLPRPRAVGEDWSKPSEKYAGFKYDFANSRWVRVEKGSRFNAGAPDKYSADNWEAGGATVVTPKSGSAYVVWPVIHQSLTKRGLQSIKPEEVLAMQQAGKAVIVDCRPRGAWERERVAGSINVPLYRPVQGKTAWDTVKRAVMAVGLAMEATERNPDFVRDAAAALGPKRLFGGPKIILYCSLGGTLTVGVPPWAPGRNKSFKDDPERAFGRESRSLKACHELLEDGYRNVSHLRGGISVWRHDGFPIETGPPQ